jgi:Ca2+-binding RTX toxin-like protein
VGTDVVTLGSVGSNIILRGIDTLVGGVGTETITLGNTVNTMMADGLETLVGGTDSDFIFTVNTGATMRISAIDTLVGGTGNDLVTLGGGGNTLILRGIDTLIGGSGADFVWTGDTGTTFLLQTGVETFVGGVGTDVVTLGSAGSTLILRGIDTLIGGVATETITLGNTINTMAVEGVDTLIGGTDSDTVTINAGPILFRGSTGGDVLVLQAGGGVDRVVYATASDGAAAGATSGFDQITNFQTGIDKIIVTGALRSAVDRNGNSTLGTANRTTNAVNLGTDELVIMSGPVSSLTDTGLVSLRNGIGTLQNTSSGASLLVLANNGASTGLYVVTDANGDGALAATEVSLLGIVNGVTDFSTGDVSLG